MPSLCVDATRPLPSSGWVHEVTTVKTTSFFYSMVAGVTKRPVALDRRNGAALRCLSRVVRWW